LAGGEVVLKGTVPTYEDKLAISRHLRQATSCSCIMNQLHVLAEPQETHLSNSRKAPATLLAPAPLVSQPILPVAHELPAEPVALGSPSPAPHVTNEITRPGEFPSIPKASRLGSMESSSSKSSRPAKLPSGHARPESQAQTPANSTGKPIVYPTKWRRLERGEIAVPTRVVSAAASKDAASSSTQRDSAASAKPRIYPRVIPSPKEDQAPVGQIANPFAGASVSRVSAKAEIPAVVKASSPSPPTTATPVSVSSRDVTAMTPSKMAPPSIKPLPISVPPAQPDSDNLAKREPYVADGVILVESMIKPATHTAPAAGSKPSPIVKTGPYVTSGVILKSDPASENETKPANPALADLQTRLQQRIAAVCGKPSKDVEVTAVTETNVAVRVKAISTLEGEDLSNRIFQLPELGPCQVSLDVLVMK
jgi:hypothetical protein